MRDALVRLQRSTPDPRSDARAQLARANNHQQDSDAEIRNVLHVGHATVRGIERRACLVRMREDSGLFRRG